MINVTALDDNVLKVQAVGKISEADFQKIGANVDQLIRTRGTAKLLVDATELMGWENMKAAQTHFTFIREHQKKIDRVALVAGQEWQHWVAGIASVFVHPEIKVFDRNGLIEAESWLRQKKAA